MFQTGQTKESTEDEDFAARRCWKVAWVPVVAFVMIICLRDSHRQLCMIPTLMSLVAVAEDHRSRWPRIPGFVADDNDLQLQLLRNAYNGRRTVVVWG
jgi:hypothetical protein